MDYLDNSDWRGVPREGRNMCMVLRVINWEVR